MAARAGLNASRKGKVSLSLDDKHTQLVLREEAKLDTEPNPFALPSTADVFDVREQERKREAEAKFATSKLKVWEKTTASSRVGRAPRVADIDVPSATSSSLVLHGATTAQRGVVAAAADVLSKERRREPKENMTNFIAKKREMFLVQMALDTKREEIQKLEQKAQAREDGLKKSELLLEEDAIRFDAFLKENDKLAHEALKAADKEAKVKSEKLQEIKKLKHAIAIVEGEKSKLLETLEDYERYKQFLDRLTPPEWVTDQIRKKRERQRVRMQTRFASKVASWEAETAAAEEAAARREEDEKRKALKEGRVYKKREGRTVDGLRPRPRFEDEVVESSGQELDMYFSRPQLLLEEFTQLEESNLFLIQNCQDSEQQLEELKQQYRDAERTWTRNTVTLEESAKTMRTLLSKEATKTERLQSRVTFSGADDSRETAMGALTKQITEVYRRCGFDPTAHPDPLVMLSAIEGKMEELRQATAMIAEADPEYLARREKDIEKDRREKVRGERMDAQKAAYALRLQVSLARSQAPVKKKTGKPVMFRSAPIVKKAEKERVDPEKEQELRDLKYFS